MFNNKKVNSNSLRAKNIIRNEMRRHVKASEYGVRTTVDAIALDANAYNCGDRQHHSDYEKAKSLVDTGCFSIYYDDEKKMLGKIYGESNVKKWNDEKTHATYRHLIAREYDSMIRERKRGGK